VGNTSRSPVGVPCSTRSVVAHSDRTRERPRRHSHAGAWERGPAAVIHSGPRGGAGLHAPRGGPRRSDAGALYNSYNGWYEVIPTRSHAPAWECRLRRSASPPCVSQARQSISWDPHDTGSEITPFRISSPARSLAGSPSLPGPTPSRSCWTPGSSFRITIAWSMSQPNANPWNACDAGASKTAFPRGSVGTRLRGFG
jgi:hypothetical protein